MGDGSEGLVLKMIGAAVLAGAYSLQARMTPEAQRGLMKMHAQRHAEAATLAERFCAAQACKPARTQW